MSRVNWWFVLGIGLLALSAGAVVAVVATLVTHFL